MTIGEAINLLEATATFQKHFGRRNKEFLHELKGWYSQILMSARAELDIENIEEASALEDLPPKTAKEVCEFLKWVPENFLFRS